jgi:hypothetical protein
MLTIISQELVVRHKDEIMEFKEWSLIAGEVDLGVV